jgi:biopolymer transport protein ExbD
VTEGRSPYRWQVRTFEAYRPPNRLNRGLVSAAPWLDGLLLLLFFLLVTSRFVLQPGLSIRLPTAPFTGGATPYGLLGVVVVQEATGDKNSEEIFYFDDERFVLGQPASDEKLKKAFAKAVQSKPGQAMVIEADQLVKHGTVVALINMAAAAGIPDVVVATRPEGAGEGT